MNAPSDHRDSPKALSREATAAAFERHRVAHGENGAEWESIADLFAEDAVYADPIYGEIKGREAIRAFLRRVMAGFDDWRFPLCWTVVGEGRVVAHFMNRLPGRRPDGTYFEFPGVSLITYGADGLITHQMDLYDGFSAVRTMIEAKTGALGRAASTLFGWTTTALPDFVRELRRRTPWGGA